MVDTTTETPAGTEAAASTESKPDRPEWLTDDPHGFWDGDKGELKAETLYKSFEDTKRLIGARVSDLGPESRRKLAEMLPDTLKGTLESELRAKLGEDPEFLAPLQEKWKSENLRTPPEAYELPELPDGKGFDPEHPLYAKATEIAKKHGLDQEAFGELMTFVTEAQADATHALSGATPEAWKAAIPDLQPRGEVVANRLKALAPAHAQELLENLRSPNAFLAVEALVKATGPKSLALEGVAANGEMTQDQIDAMILSPDYNRAGSEARAKVDSWYKRRHGDHL
jgi:hypothetical protein